MKNRRKMYSTSSMPFQEKKKKGIQPMPHYSPVSQPVSKKDRTSSSLYDVARWRIESAVFLLLSVSLSMLVMGVLLFFGAPLCLPPPLFPSSFSLIGLTGVSGGVGLLLWSMRMSLLKPHPKGRPAQRPLPFSSTALLTTGGMTVLPPEPMARPTGGLFPSPQDCWISSAWGREPQRQIEACEALRVRQRLQTLRLSYVDDFSR